MKHIIFILICFLPCLFVAAQQEPDLEKLNTIGEKINAWHEYCNALLGQVSNEKLNIKIEAAAKKGLALAPKDSLSAKAMFALYAGVATENIKRYADAENYFKYALAIAQKIKHQNYMVLALTRLDNIYSYTNNTEKRNQIIAIVKTVGDTTTNPDTKEALYTVLAGYYTDINNYDSSITYRLKVIDMQKKLIEKSGEKKSLNLAYAYSNLGNMYNQMGQYAKALEYLYQSADIIGDRALTDNEETLYLYFMDTFSNLKMEDSLLKYYRLIVTKMARRDTLYNVLASANRFMGSYYNQANKPNNAFYFASKAYELSKKNPNADVRIQANTLYASLLSQRKQFNQAVTILNQTLKEDFSFDKQLLATIHHTYSDCYVGLQQWDSAYKYYKLYSEANASELAATGEKNIADAEAIYQNREKRLQIEARNILLKNAEHQKWWLIGGLLLLGLAATLLLIIYRNKRKTASLLDNKNKSLHQLNNDLDEANKTKAKLFSIIGHDLRSPINQVYQFLQLQQLNPDALSVQQKSDLNQKIQKATGSLLETMEDLLLWSKTQMGAFKVAMLPVNIADSMKQVLALLQLNIDAKHLAIVNQIPEQLTINSDPNYLQTIVRNLLQNAVKASPENGKIILQANQSSISITNEGDAFTQAQYEQALQDNETTKGLSGLGLKLVDELSRKINARIYFTNETAGTTTAVLKFE